MTDRTVVAGLVAGGLLMWGGYRLLRPAPVPPVRVRRAITIARDPGAVYLFWRRLENLPRFMDHLESVEWLTWDTTEWVATEGGRRVAWRAQIVADEPGRLLAWRSLPGADVENEGVVRFLTAPGGRGTELHVDVSWALPTGVRWFGSAAGPLLRRIAKVQLGQELHRLQQLLETGELATGVRFRSASLEQREPIRGLRRYGQPALEAFAAAEVLP